MSALIRRTRDRYYPRYGDPKHKQAIRRDSIFWFGADDSDAILQEIAHRQQRSGSSNRPAQPWADADLKVWRRRGRVRGAQDLLAHLEAVEKARPH